MSSFYYFKLSRLMFYLGFIHDALFILEIGFIFPSYRIEPLVNQVSICGVICSMSQ